MAKVAMIAAGSLVFCKTLIADFLATPALKGSEYRLMAPSHKRLDKMHDFVKRMIKDNGVDATVVGNLPPQCAALNRTNVLVQQLAGEASFTGDPEMVMQAIALDPLTAAVLTLDDIRRMTAEMLDAEAKFLPQFAGKKLRTVPAITVPKDVRRQEVPVDPAMAIANRFGKLANA